MKLSTANGVLGTFSTSRIERRTTGWYVCWNRGGKEFSRRWSVRHGQDFFPPWSLVWAHGGTACTALSQLIRWLRNQPVLPLATWKYWSSDKVRLLPPYGVQLLRDGGYPIDVPCVRCGRILSGPLDWWNDSKKSGPCCRQEDCKL